MVRTPTVLQSQTTECGLAALSMMLAFHGRHVPMRELRTASNLSRDGTNARTLLALAAQYGLTGAGNRCDRIDSNRFAFPLIAHCGFNHFVVVEAAESGRVYLNDPSSGRRDVTVEDFHEGYTGVVLTFERSPRFRAAGHGFNWVTALRQLLAGSRSTLTLLLGLRLASAAVICWIAALLQTAVDGLPDSSDATLQPLLLFALALAAATATVLNASEQRLLATLEERISVNSTRALFDHVRTLSMDFFNYRMPDWIQGLLQSNRHVAASVCGPLGTAFAGIIGLPVLLLLMAAYDYRVALFVLICAIAITAIERLNQERRSSLSRLARIARARSDGFAEDRLARIESLKIGERADEVLDSLTGFQSLAIEAEQDWSAELARATGIRTLVLSLAVSFFLALLGWELKANRLTAGGVAALWIVATAFLHAVAQWAVSTDLIGLLRDTLLQKDDVESTPSHGAARQEFHSNPDPPATPVLLEARSLSFGYSRSRPCVIDDVSLSLMAGTETGIIAIPGSGASTLVRLLTGLQEPWNGEVLLEGVPVRTIPGEALAARMALVARDGFFFDGTVRDNVCLWDERVSDEELSAALKDACIDELLAGREGGHLHRVASGGANFSGGERQRLLIARALIRRPRLLILDQATDLLDLSLEAALRQNLRRRGCTTLIVSQRRDTIQSCEQILALTRGRLVRQI